MLWVNKDKITRGDHVISKSGPKVRGPGSRLFSDAGKNCSQAQVRTVKAANMVYAHDRRICVHGSAREKAENDLVLTPRKPLAHIGSS
jgi:hypothetical protein